MAAPIMFSLRPLERTSQNTVFDQQSFRIHLAPKYLKELGFNIGDTIQIFSPKGFHGYALAWSAQVTNPVNKPIAKIHDILREKYQLTLSDAVSLEKFDGASQPLSSVTVRFSLGSDATGQCTSMEDLKRQTQNALDYMDLILPGCAIDVHLKGARYRHRTSRLRATIESLEPEVNTNDPQLYHFDPHHTQLKFADSDLVEAKPANPNELLKLSGESLWALSHHVDTINRQLSILSHPYFNIIQQPTFLVHGPEGSGKTFLLGRFLECPWRRVFRIDEDWLAINRKVQRQSLAEVFDSARALQPSLILMDDLEAFLKKAEGMVRILRTELAKLEGTRVIVAAATRNVLEIDASLRDSQAFNTELEIFPPNANQREEILRQMLGSQEQVPRVNLAVLAEKTHGFLARDLNNLYRRMREHCVHRLADTMAVGTESFNAETFSINEYLDQQDVDAAINRVQGSVLKDDVIDVPKVRWGDIAGVEHVRKELEAIIVRPYKYPDAYVRFNVRRPRKGVLMFGPPGCAKTLIAQAVATESNLNFLAVKGSELIKMYVGESERAIRDVFRRARTAKPCIIFFDEIDAIGESREQTHSGLNVVTTLLNEMDGIEALRDVFIIGATNRPDILDSALIRPGRFDSHIHIGLPTEEARREIIEIHTRKQPLAEDVDFEMLASKMDGASGADVASLCAEAVELALDDYINNPDSQPLVHMHHFVRVLEKFVPKVDKEAVARFEGWQPGKSLSATN